MIIFISSVAENSFKFLTFFNTTVIILYFYIYAQFFDEIFVFGFLYFYRVFIGIFLFNHNTIFHKETFIYRNIQFICKNKILW